MIVRIYLRYLQFLDSYATPNPYTWVYGMGRTMLAIGGIITFLFSSPSILFDRTLFGKLSLDPFFERINLFFLFGFDNLLYAQILAILILLSVVFGFLPRITGILHWWVAFSLQQAGSILEGGDQITSILTFLLIPITLLDSRTNHWSTQSSSSLYKNYIGNILFTIISIQMSVVYFHAAVEKLYKSAEWRNGTALYYFANDSQFGFPDWSLPIVNKILPEAVVVSTLTWSVIIFEILLFGALFMSDYKRRILFPFAVMFHLLIAVFFGLVSFFFAMTGGLILYLLPRYVQLRPFRTTFLSSATGNVTTQHTPARPIASTLVVK